MPPVAPPDGNANHDWLRIGVNLFPLSLGGGGARQYVLELLPWLLRLSPHRLVLFHGPQGQPSVAQLLRRLHPAQRNRVRTVSVENQEEIYRHATAFDFYFCPLNCLVPDLLDRPTLVTLHDVQERFFPHYFSADELRARAESYPHAAHAASVLLTVSEFSKRSICEGFGVAGDKVRVAYHAADALAETPAAWPAGMERPPAPYFFYPANLYPHKNHGLLLDALRLLQERGLNCACVLTGQPVRGGADVGAEARARGLSERVCWLRRVSSSALRYLYENALALAFPSRFEGFGLPLVEAMRCGCPVVTTATASIPEVVGDAALLVAATPEAFADALARLLTDADLRADLAARGRARAEWFTGPRLAEQTLQAIEHATQRFFFPHDGGEGPAVSYVVQVSRGGRKLARTLASLSFEVREHDEVLVLAERAAVGAEAEALAVNLGVARFIGRSAGAWLEGHGSFLCYLREGDRLCERASRAALDVFAAHPEARAVVGSALGVDRRQRLVGLHYRPPLPYRPGFGASVPPAAVFWRRDWLTEQGAALDDPHWPDLLLAQAGEGVCPLNRTVAYVPALRPPVREVARRWLRRMPRWLHQPLRGLYRRLVRPVSPREAAP